MELDEEGQDNIIAALEHHDRVIGINIRGQKCLALEKFAAAMERPFPVLTDLNLSSSAEIAPVLHEEFLGGSVPCLRSFVLLNIAFPAFPKLALVATHLSTLTLYDIPMTGYISSEAMATCLAMLPSLGFLYIGIFQSPRSLPDRISLPPPTRAILPALIRFVFEGISEYMEDLVFRIDTPNLNWLGIHFFMDLMLNIPQLHKFIARTETIRPLSPAEIIFSSSFAEIRLGPHYGIVELRIHCEGLDRQASSTAQLCSQLSPLLSHVERLDIREHSLQRNGINPMQWFDLCGPFPAVRDLYIYDELRPLVARALQGLTGERATEVLPTLRSLYLRGPFRPVRGDIQAFIAARQHSNYPVDVYWE